MTWFCSPEQLRWGREGLLDVARVDLFGPVQLTTETRSISKRHSDGDDDDDDDDDDSGSGGKKNPFMTLLAIAILALILSPLLVFGTWLAALVCKNCYTPSRGRSISSFLLQIALRCIIGFASQRPSSLSHNCYRCMLDAKKTPVIRTLRASVLSRKRTSPRSAFFGGVGQVSDLPRRLRLLGAAAALQPVVSSTLLLPLHRTPSVGSSAPRRPDFDKWRLKSRSASAVTRTSSRLPSVLPEPPSTFSTLPFPCIDIFRSPSSSAGL